MMLRVRLYQCFTSQAREVGEGRQIHRGEWERKRESMSGCQWQTFSGALAGFSNFSAGLTRIFHTGLPGNAAAFPLLLLLPPSYY